MTQRKTQRIASHAVLIVIVIACSTSGPPQAHDDTTARGPSELVVQVLDVGQGDAVFIENGGSRVLIDGGPDPATLGRHLDRLGLNGDTIDVVVVTHAHVDHYNGLRELFRSDRHIAVRFFFENKDLSPNTTLATLRDSVIARADRGSLVYRDTDDPCGTGAPLCTITMRGGATLHVLRPLAEPASANDRSTPVKLVGPDSASFVMWLAGDAEREAIAAFDSLGYDEHPGMSAEVMKGDHHGSCNGATPRYLDLVHPRWVVFSLGVSNTYGHVHQQTLDLLRARGLSWYRTDQNGTVTIRTAGTQGSGFTITPDHGAPNAIGPSDRFSEQAVCAAGGGTG
jgi:competence protein ComEC